MKRVLVTGANGFIGQCVISHLAGKCQIRVSVRNNNATLKHLDKYTEYEIVTIGDLSADTDWTQALTNVDVVIHLAGRAHITNDTAESPINEFRKINRDASLQLLKQAAKHQVSRFVFVSSIGVNGNITTDTPFTETSKPKPNSDYAVSKMEAEQQLSSEARKLDIELVIVRPPLVYGPLAPGNLDKLIKLVKRSPILPFGMVNNRKSFISNNNLADFLVTCAFHPQAANELFLIADDQVISTKELTNLLAKSYNKQLFNIPIPVFLMRAAAIALGKKGMATQLFDNLVIDNSKAKRLLNWQPPESAKKAIKKIIK